MHTNLRTLVISIFLLSGLAIAQGDKVLFGINGGPSIPIGDYANAEANSEDAGYAETGRSFNLLLQLKIGSGFGIAGEGHIQTNPIDVGALAHQLSVEFPGPSWDVESLPYITGGFFCGIFKAVPLGESEIFEIVFKGLVGVLNTTSPDATITADNGGSTTQGHMKKAENQSFAWTAGGGMKYNFSEHFCLIGNLDYLYTNPTLKVETEIGGTSEFNSSNQVIESINFGFGIGFRI